MSEAIREAEAVRRQLERVLAAAGFARNERLSRFLRFIVERRLAGHDAELKETVIAIEVFGRSDHDPQQDSIVRTEASRLRARLGEYYLGEGKDDPLIIELPKGGYVPVIREAEGRLETAASVKTGSVQSPVRGMRLGTRFWGAISLAGLVGGIAVAAWWRHQNEPIPIAVLPLINLNQDPADDYFVDGLTAEIIRDLSIIEGLTVRSETSSFAFKGKPQTARDAGKQLDAEYILEGSVLRSGQQLRINAQLVRARDDSPLWSTRYDRALADIFTVQDEISRGIVNSLRLKLGRGRRRYETSTEAYDLYLRARAQNGWGGPRAQAQSVPLFEEAIAKDPSFAPAYAGLAQAHVVLSGNANFDIPEEVPKLRAAAEKALELDPLSAESYDALGAAYAREAQWAQSEKSFLRAIEIQPGRAESHTHFAAFFFLPLGRIDEAIRQLRIAEKNDPLSPEVQFWLGDALADAGRDQEAAVICERLLPGNRSTEQCFLGARVRQGRAGEVLQIYEQDPTRRRVGAALGCALARSGRSQEAEEVAANTAANPGAISEPIFACLGDKDRIFESLDRRAAIGPIRMGLILNRVDRENRGLLRGDPRLKALRNKVGLPE